MKHKRKDSKKPVWNFFLGTASGLAAFISFLLIFSVFITKKEVPDHLPIVFLLFSSFLGSMIASFICKAKMRQKGIVPVLISFALITVPIMMIILTANLFSVSLSILAVLPADLAGAFTGGFTASRIR